MTVSGDPQTVAVLKRLDWQLGEAGRREHRFAWLRDPHSREWLSVDAYYPSSRVVVVASDDPEALEHCEQVVPANGLFLLTIESADLEGDSDRLAATLRVRLTHQGWVPRPAGGDGAEVDALAPRPDPGAHPTAVAPRETWAATTAPSRRRSGDPAAGVALVLIVVAELVIGGGVIGLGAGDYVLGFGLVLDGCARVLGAVAASQRGDPDAAWSSVLFGSLALWSRDAGDGDAAALAHATAIVAGAAVVLGLVLAVL